MTPARILALGLAVSVTAGCTAAPPPTPEVATVDDLVLPFDTYKPTPGQRGLLDAAHRVFVARCLTRRGFRPGSLPPAPPDPRNTRRYGVTDPAQARTHGYHLPGPLTVTAGPGRGGALTSASGETRNHLPTPLVHGGLRPSFLTPSPRPSDDAKVRTPAPGRGAEQGAPRPSSLTAPAASHDRKVRAPAPRRRDGNDRHGRKDSRKKARKAERRLIATGECEARAVKQLGPSAKAPWRWLARRDAQTLERSSAHPAVEQAKTQWAECMRRAGHPYPTPEDAIADPRWHLEKPEVGELERRTAVADATCKWSSGLVARWFEADTAVQRELVREHAGRFALLRADLSERVQRATALLRRHSSAGTAGSAKRWFGTRANQPGRPGSRS